MMQPIDIKTQKYKKSLFGYKQAEVDQFIDVVYKAYEELYKENAELSSNLEKLNESLQESRLKMFDLENKLQKMENVSSVGEDDSDAKKRADAIIKNAEKAAADIIANAKKESKKFESAEPVKEEPKAEPKVEPVKEEPKQSASSRFFKMAEEKAPVGDDDDEIFVGEIEDARKPERMMIGDGEEEEDMDFEFL